MSLITLVAICADYALAPALDTTTPALSCGLLFLLLLRRRTSRTPTVQRRNTWKISPQRLCLFGFLHAAAIGLTWVSAGAMKNAHPGNFSSIAIAAAKYTILAPTAILLAPTGWRRFDRLYRPEWVAAAIALFTLMPYRLFRMAWPWYSQLLGTTVYTLARHVVSGLSYVAFPAPTVVGPALDVTIDFSCGGLDGVRFFQLLSAIMLVLDWTALNGIRTMGAYFGGLFMVLAANALRITLLVTLGNHFSPDPVVRYHLFLGWILYALLFSTYVAVTYTWLLKRPAFRLLVPMDHANQTL